MCNTRTTLSYSSNQGRGLCFSSNRSVNHLKTDWLSHAARKFRCAILPRACLLCGVASEFTPDTTSLIIHGLASLPALRSGQESTCVSHRVVDNKDCVKFPWYLLPKSADDRSSPGQQEGSEYILGRILVCCQEPYILSRRWWSRRFRSVERKRCARRGTPGLARRLVRHI